jgi:hypothetical protein
MIRRVTVDPSGRIYEVTNMFDRHANPTEKSAVASTCVIKLGPARWIDQDVVDIPIYTVH